MIVSKICRFLLWILLKIIWTCYTPLFFIRLFYKKKVCPPIKNDILFLPAAVLAEKIRTKEVSSEFIIKSYIERIREVNPFLNAVVEERFEDALEEAVRIEDLLNSNLTMEEIEKNYPLLGVPITIKGSIAVQGLNHSAGVLLRNKKALKDADVVEKIRNMGAIPLLVSNTPEFCLNWETTNKLIGTTNNPYDLRKTVGGSSGGEAALISAGASVIGIGSDIAGSLRIPMHFCGVWGHKPTARLISIDGHYPSCPEEEWPDFFHIGPISRYATDLSMLFEILTEAPVKCKLKNSTNLKNLKIYYLKEIKNSLTSRANSDTKKAIEKVVSFFNNFTETTMCREINSDLFNFASEYSYLRLLQVDNVENLFEGKGEGSHMELLRFLFCLSKSVFTTIAYGLMRWWLWIIPKKLKKKVNEDLDDLKRDLLEILDDHTVLILPTFTTEANFHGDVLRNIFDYGYCSIFNALGFPVTECPIMQTSDGMPIGIQVVGAPYCDRLCLKVAEEIEKAFGGWKPPTMNNVEAIGA